MSACTPNSAVPWRAPQRRIQRRAAQTEQLHASQAPKPRHTQHWDTHTHKPAGDLCDASRVAAQQLERVVAPPTPYVPAPTAAGRAAQLTAHICRRTHWTQLQRLWLDAAPAPLGPVHLTAALVTLARLVRTGGATASDRPELFKFSGALMSAAAAAAAAETSDEPVHGMPWSSSSSSSSPAALDARGCAMCLWAYARLQHAAPHRSGEGDAAADVLAQALLAVPPDAQAGVMAPRMACLGGGELAQAAWAVAALTPLGLRVPDGWWAAHAARAAELAPHLKPQETACCVWAANAARAPPLPRALMAALLARAGSTIQEYGAAELLQLLLVSARWPRRDRPDGRWLARAWCRLADLVPNMGPQDVSNALLALARHRRTTGGDSSSSNSSSSSSSNSSSSSSSSSHNRSSSSSHNRSSNDDMARHQAQRLATVLLARLPAALPSCGPIALITVPYSLAVLQLRPGRSWWGVYLPYAAAHLGACDAAGLAVLAWALARLQVQPGDGWLQELLAAAARRLPGSGPQELAMLLWALGVWGAAPPVWWWQRLSSTCSGALRDVTAAELGALLCGAGGMARAARARLPPQQQQHSRHQQQNQQGAAQARSPLQPAPPVAWAVRMLPTTVDTLAGAPAECLAGILTGLARLRLRPDNRWVAAFEAATTAAAPRASLRSCAGLMWGAAVLQLTHQHPVLMAALHHRVCELLLLVDEVEPSSRQQQLQHQQPHWPSDKGGEEWLPVPVGASGPDGYVVSDVAIACQLLGAAARSCRGSSVAHSAAAASAAPPWTDDLLVRLQPQLQGASAHSLVLLLAALARLRHVPACPSWLGSWWTAYASRLAEERETPALRPLAAQRLLHAALPPDAGATDAAPSLMGCEGPAGGGQAIELASLALWALRRLGGTTLLGQHPHWLPQLLTHSAPMLARADGWQLSSLLSQLLHAHVWPGEDWLAAATAAACAGVSSGKAEPDELDEYQRSLHVLSCMGHTPSCPAVV